MTLTVIQHPEARGTQDVLYVLDKIRAEVEAGEIIGFAGVALTPDDQVRACIGTVQHVSRLRVYGAVSHLLHCLQAGEV